MSRVVQRRPLYDTAAMDTNDPVESQRRLHNLGIAVSAAWAAHELPQPAEPRSVATDDDVVGFISMGIITLDRVLNDETLTGEQVQQAIAGLTAAMDFIRPLPAVNEPDYDGDPVTDDLVTIVKLLRTATTTVGDVKGAELWRT